jgi:hypothetical protein
MLIAWFSAMFKMSLRSCSDPFSIVKVVSPLWLIGVAGGGTSSYSLLLYRMRVFMLVSETTGWDTDLEMIRGIFCEEDKKSLP